LVVGAGTGTTLQDIDRPVGPVLPVFSGLAADTYIVQVTDQVSGCAVTTSVGISSSVISITSAVAATPTCNPIGINVQTSGILTFPGQYSIINSATGVQVVPPTNFGTANFTTLPVAVPGSYTIQINAQGCIATRNVSVVSDPQVAVVLSSNACANPITVTASGGSGYSWTGPNITSLTNIATITATPPQGPQTYTVTVSAAGQCPTTSSIIVNVNNNVAVSFTQSDACTDQVTLTASAVPAGSYTYRWYRNGVLIPGGQSIIAGLADNGISYRVEAFNTLSGCTFTSPAAQVFVAGDLQVIMSTTPPCQGSPFTLTATTTPASSGANLQWAYNGTNVAGAISATHNDTRSGLYKVTATLPGCIVDTEQQIFLFPLPKGALPDKELICNDAANPDPETREVLLDAGNGFISYQWYQGGVISPNTTQTFLVTEPGIYSVDIENSYNCFGTDQTEVIEECRPRIIAPTAFRPGSQNDANNSFYLFHYFIDEDDFQVFIFNRWGEMVHQSREIDFRWNGGYKNNASQLLPAGTYTYVVKYKSKYKSGVLEHRGGVVLIR
jgi:gliding motility-associated-like protein